MTRPGHIVFALIGAAVFALIGAAAMLASIGLHSIDGPTSPANSPANSPTNSPANSTPSDPNKVEELAQRALVFSAQPESSTGRDLAQAMAATGDPGWVPWLLDLHRLTYSSQTDAASIEALAHLTGIDPVGRRDLDFAAYGTWARSHQPPIDPGPHYRTWKLDLYQRFDLDYRSLLEPVDDTTLPHLHWGGVPRGGIPELNNPTRVTPAHAPWMEPDELVVGIALGGRDGTDNQGETVAYPIRIIGRHELVNDTVGGHPLSLVYCTLCRTAIAFDRRVGGQTLTFQTSGLLLDSNKVMVDVETDTLWHHLAGTGLAGPLAATELTVLASVTTTWDDWLTTHPDTLVVDRPDPIFYDDPERPPLAYDYDADPYAAYYASDQAWFPTAAVGSRFEPKHEVIGLATTTDDAHLAISVPALIESGPTLFTLGADPEAERFLAVPSKAGARVYKLTANARTSDTGIAEIAETTENTVTLGDGTTHPRVSAPQLFWFAWSNAHPETGTWPPE